jgi:hypothetical protein
MDDGRLKMVGKFMMNGMGDGWRIACCVKYLAAVLAICMVSPASTVITGPFHFGMGEA